MSADGYGHDTDVGAPRAGDSAGRDPVAEDPVQDPVRDPVQDPVRRAWRAAQQSCLTRRCPVTLPSDPDWSALDCPAEVLVAAWALLRHSPEVPMPAVAGRAVPLTPDDELTGSLLSACQQLKIIRIHPGTPVGAFVWNTTEDEAVAAAAGDPAALPEPDWDEFYLYEVQWYAPFGPSLGTAAENLGHRLAQRLSPARLTRQDADDLVDLVVEVIARETVRYLEHLLAVHDPAPVTEDHRTRLMAAAIGLAEVRSLAECYHVAGATTRTAALARSCPADVTARAVELFEEHAQRYAADPSLVLEPFGEAGPVPLSAITRTLFGTLLGAGAMDTTRAGALAILTEAGAGSRPAAAGGADLLDIMRAVLATEADGDPHRVYAVLVQASAGDDEELAAAGDELIQIVERLRTVGYTLGGALAGAVSACALLTTVVPVPGPDTRPDGASPVERPVGLVLAEAMHRATGRAPVHRDADPPR